jgi:SAM-dependent MidA family methyltransferase
MTTLADLLIARIRENGPLTIAEYMAECLMHPNHGYYATRDPFGTAGDFTTAPEISQMFGELIGLCLAQTWMDQGAPSPFALVELGPGRGTLMTDVMRANRAVPGFHNAAHIHLVETSPKLRTLQSETIKATITHHDHLETVPDLPLFLIANEFFDALPTRQFQRDGAAWRERLIGLQDESLGIGLSDPTTPTFLETRLADTKDGDVVEHAQATQAIASEIGQRIAKSGGTALIIDYGDWRSLGDTLQAISDHAPVSPLAAPGASDLTTHVDFEAVASAAHPAAHSRVTPQGVFLERLGITERARKLAQTLQGDDLESHIKAHRRLTHAQEMGTLFKVMALYPDTKSPPPGLEP